MSALQTIYLQNIPEKISFDELKKAIYFVFTEKCGPVLEVSLRKGNKYRGQAWVTFDSIGSATNAVNTMNGFSFYGKPLKVYFAKNKADIIAKADGTYVPHEKRAQTSSTDASATKRKLDSQDDDHPSKKFKSDETSSQDIEEIIASSETNAPHNILFVSGLPPKITSFMVENLFKPTAGFTSVRLHESIPGIAFVEYDTIENAQNARSTFNNYKISQQDTLKIGYSK